MAETMITGGCLCGNIRYSSSARPEMSLKCYCRRCQHITGTGHACSLTLAEEKVSFTGELRYYESPSDAGSPVQNGFCPTCGSPILTKTKRFPGRLYFLAGSLDDPAQFQPEFSVFGESAQPWDKATD